MSELLIAALDPGASGGLAVIDDRGRAQAWPFPATERDIHDLVAEFAPRISVCYLEAVHSFPRQGATSTFAFGRNYGFLRGLLIALKVPFVEVSPQRWKKAMGLQMSSKDAKVDKKNLSKRLAQQLYPDIKITHAISEALLLATYGRGLQAKRERPAPTMVERMVSA